MARTLFCVPLLLLIGACSGSTDGRLIAEAQAEVANFHDLLQRREFDTIYQQSSTEFRAHAPREDLIALFDAIDRKLGPLQTSQQSNMSAETRNLVTTVMLEYQSRYERGEATETFTYRIRSGAPELMGYNIASLDMLIR